jgi:hypothetical protein
MILRLSNQRHGRVGIRGSSEFLRSQNGRVNEPLTALYSKADLILGQSEIQIRTKPSELGQHPQAYENVTGTIVKPLGIVGG